MTNLISFRYSWLYRCLWFRNLSRRVHVRTLSFWFPQFISKLNTVLRMSHGNCFCLGKIFTKSSNLIHSKGSVNCSSCNPGHHANGAQSLCLPCSRGSYNPYYAQTACSPCGTGHYNPYIGSTSFDNCLVRNFLRMGFFVDLVIKT